MDNFMKEEIRNAIKTELDCDETHFNYAETKGGLTSNGMDFIKSEIDDNISENNQNETISIKTERPFIETGMNFVQEIENKETHGLSIKSSDPGNVQTQESDHIQDANFAWKKASHREILYGKNGCIMGVKWLFKCEVCQKTFSEDWKLEKHKTIHISGVESFVCDLCKMLFLQSNLLVDHIMNNHSGKKDKKQIFHQCEQCDYKTRLKANLRRHIKSIHIGIKSEQNHSGKKVKKQIFHQCEQCEYKTRLKANLKRHIKSIHIGIKSEQNDFTATKLNCDQCDFKTHWKLCLKRHVKTIHRLKYNCEQCEFQTNLMSYLKLHVKSIHDS